MADAQVQEVKDKTDILQVVSERIEVSRAGRSYKACCPFHAEKTPSFFVSPEMQVFKCFGCGESGDVISFVQKYEGLTFPEALEQLAKKAGVTLVRRQTGEDQSERDRLFSLLELSKEYYHYLLTKHSVGKNAKNYLWERKIGPSLIDEFELGYAVDNWEALLTYLTKKKGFSEKELEQAGLVIPGNRGTFYDRFRGRVIFPLHDYTGRVVGFSGRVLNPEVKEAKYINTPETKLYHKRETLYGIHLAKQHIRSQDRVVVVEGEMDVLGSRRAGVKETVAIKGSALTQEQIGLIRRLTRNVVLALDADEAGEEAMLRGMKLLEQEQMNLRIVDLSGGKDPDEIAKENPSGWNKQVDEALSVYAYYLALAERRFSLSTGQGKKEASEFLVPIFVGIENAVEQAYYTKKAATMLGVQEDVFRQELQKYLKRGVVHQAKPSSDKPEERKVSRREKLERYVIALALQQNEAVGSFIKKLSPRWFAESYLRQLVDDIQRITDFESATLSVLRKKLPQEKLALVQELYTGDVDLLDLPIQSIDELFLESISELQAVHKHERISWLNKQLAKEDLSSEELSEFRKELAAYRMGV